MKKLSKILALLMIAVLAFSVFAGCSSNEEADTPVTSPDAEGGDEVQTDGEGEAQTGGEGAVDRIKEAGKLVMLTNAAFPPFEFLGDDNSIVGVDVEIAQAIADELGVELEIVNMDFDGIVPAIQTGRGDLGVAGITADDTRREQVDFSINYVDTAQYIIVSEDNTDIVDAASLAGKNVGVQRGTTGDIWVTDNTEAEVHRYGTGPDAGAELALGRLDAVVIDEMPAQEIAAANEGLKVIETPLTTEQYAIAIAKENTDLKEVVDTVLTRLIEDGSIEAWIEEYKAAA